MLLIKIIFQEQLLLASQSVFVPLYATSPHFAALHSGLFATPDPDSYRDYRDGAKNNIISPDCNEAPRMRAK